MVGVMVRLICRDRAPAISPIMPPATIAAAALTIEPPIKPDKAWLRTTLGLKLI